VVIVAGQNVGGPGSNPGGAITVVEFVNIYIGLSYIYVCGCCDAFVVRDMRYWQG